MENLNKRPPKSILKSSSFDTQAFSPRASITGIERGDSIEDEEEFSQGAGGQRKKSTKFDEMNILATLHPEDKDYGFMKIEEPKTPFNYYEEEEEHKKPREILLDPEELAEKIKEKGIQPPKCLVDGGDDDEDDGDGDGGAHPSHPQFESKRKAHYNEYFAVKLARQLIEKEQDEEDDSDSSPSDSPTGSGKFIPLEEI